MKRRTRKGRGQATLYARAATVDVIAEETTRPVVEALADLLLEATGQRREPTEVDDESEDHA
jgi:hypothetical protein